MDNEIRQQAIREGVRHGILDSLRQDVERTGGVTARRIVLAGVVGVVGALGVTLLIAGHPFGHHHSWHLMIVSAVWTGLLVVSLVVAFLGLRTPTLPLARAATVGVVGLGVAGICGALCPDQHFLSWWNETPIGDAIVTRAGRSLAASCFGLVTTFLFGTISALCTLAPRMHASIAPLAPAIALWILLLPAVALQSFGTSVGVFLGWAAGTAAGAYGGIVMGIRIRGRASAD